MLKELSENYYLIGVGVYMSIFCSILIFSGLWYMDSGKEFTQIMTLWTGGMTLIPTLLAMILIRESIEERMYKPDYKIVQESGKS